MSLDLSLAVCSRSTFHGDGVNFTLTPFQVLSTNTRSGFYINLPLGAVTLIILALFFHPKANSLSTLPVAQKIQHLDLPGLGLFIPAVVMLLLAVQWGGNKHAWKSATIIGLVVGSFLILCVFAAWEWHQGDGASIPSRIMGQRNVYSASAMGFLAMGAVQLIGYYILIWFQVVKDNTPEKSGIRLIPFVLGNFAMSIIAGGLGVLFLFSLPLPTFKAQQRECELKLVSLDSY
jgi:hypothetical protein